MSVCLCIPSPFITFCVPEYMFVKLGMYIIERGLISVVYFLNPSHQSVCLYVDPSAFDRQGLLIKTLPWQWIHTTIVEFLDASFSVVNVS
jgi:hypothetical protein